MPGIGIGDVKKHKEVYGMLVTPMYTDEDQTINYENLLALVDWSIAQGVDGLVVAPSIGEAPLMMREEREEVFRVCIEHVQEEHPDKNITMIAMTSDAYTRGAVDYADYAKDLGYDGQQVTAPYYWIPSEPDVVYHYEKIWERTGLPIILYHNPGLSKVEMSRALIAKIASSIPLMGIKETETDPYTKLTELFKMVGNLAPIYTTFRSFGWGLMLGARGGFINTPTLPVCMKLAKLFDAGEIQKVIELQEKITMTFPRKGERTQNPISLTKAMAEIVTGIKMGDVREPYLPASEEFKNDFTCKYRELEEYMETL